MISKILHKRADDYCAPMAGKYVGPTLPQLRSVICEATDLAKVV